MKRRIVSPELETKRTILLYCCLGICIILFFIITLVEKKMQIDIGWLKIVLMVIGGIILILVGIETFRIAKNSWKDKDKGISRKLE